jgi:hypothetical protein
MGGRIKMSFDIYIDVSYHLKSQARTRDSIGLELNAESKQEAAATPQRIIEAAAMEFRKNGQAACVGCGTMIRALTMSRIVSDSELSSAILHEARKHLVSS